MSPLEEYSQRLAARDQLLTRLDRLHERLGLARLVLAAIAIVLAWFCLVHRSASPGWLLAPVGVFLLTVLYHQRVRTQRTLAQRAVAYHRQAIERLQGHATGTGPAGERFDDSHHVYAADLDLFGAHGLFPTLCTARTPMGESTLAAWLLAPAPVAVILGRQACVAELRERHDLREDLAILGDAAAIVMQRDAITRWLEAPNELSSPALRVTAVGLSLAALVAAIAWAVSGIAFPFLAVLVLEAALNYALRGRVQRSVEGIERAYEDIRLLATLLRRIEAETFIAPPLRELKSRLAAPASSRAGAIPSASRTLSKLATLVNFVEARRNPFLTPLLLPLMYVVQSALAAERWRSAHGAVVGEWLGVLGEFEALESIAAYGFERPDDPFPEFCTGSASFTASGLGHPLLGAAVRVRNDVDISGATRVLLVSGSNMSGKSTLLRAVGMNTVLAMAGAPVCARKLVITPLQVGASIHVSDSLEEGSSRFYAEITRLKQLFEPSRLPLLFLLDELLQGTNSTDRRIGAHGIVRALLARGAIGCISTHDLALTEGSDFGAGALRNVHFQDELRDARLTFDFKLRDGVVTRSNGIELMRAIGLEV